MTLLTPKRKSGLPSPATRILSSNRKSKIQTPNSRRIHRSVSNLLGSSKKGDIIERSTSTPNTSDIQRGSSSISFATPNATLEAAKRSLDLSPCFLPEKKKSSSDTSDVQKSAAKKKLHPASSLLSSTSSAVSSLDNEEAVKVCVRVKPLLENDDEPRAFVLGAEENTIIRDTDGSDSSYKFNRVYGETSLTQQLYDEMVSGVVESVGCQGRNGTVFTYGQTSTGKTHTMHGILVAAGKDLFAMVEGDDAAKCDEFDPPASTSLTTIRISCMELYNEDVRDLLTTSTVSLAVQEDRRGNILIPNLTERTVGDIDELMKVIQIAEENRTVGSTAMNERSSRSHTIFRITYEKKETKKAGGSFDELVFGDEIENKENDSSGCIKSSRSSQKVITTKSTLNLVDLAGSESVRVTGAKGERQKEGGKINQSLLTLSRVMAKLGQKDRGHINYRDSKLTRILKPSLSGDARMSCICCISPAVQYLEESKSTLDFASRTMLVTTNAKSNQKVEYDDALVAEFEKEIERIKMETAKAEESRLQMEQSLKDAEDQIVCLRASIELEKSKASGFEKQKNEYIVQVEELKVAGNENSTDKLLKEIDDLKKRYRELEVNASRCEAENKMLKGQQELDRDSFNEERKFLEEAHACIQKEINDWKESNSELEANMIHCEAEKKMLREQHEQDRDSFNQEQARLVECAALMVESIELEKGKGSSLEKRVEELTAANENSTEKSIKEISDLMERIRELEDSMIQCETEKKMLKKQNEQDRDLSKQERKRLDEGHVFMEEMHKLEMHRLKNEKEEIDAMYKEIQKELECNSEELQTLRESNNETDNKLLDRVAELEHVNVDLSRRLAAANQSSQDDDEIATLKSKMAALSDEKLQVEWKLARELQKAKKRKDEAKERRQKFKGRISGMTETLKTDLVQLSYKTPA